MANILPAKPITTDSLSATGEKVPEWMQNFLHEYNINVNSVNTAVRGGLTTGPNIAGTRFPETGWNTYQTGPKYSSGQFIPIKFNWTAQQYKQPDHLQTTWNPQNGSVGSSPVGIPPGGWSYNASTNLITVNMITGLANNTSYYYWFTAT